MSHAILPIALLCLALAAPALPAAAAETAGIAEAGPVLLAQRKKRRRRRPKPKPKPAPAPPAPETTAEGDDDSGDDDAGGLLETGDSDLTGMSESAAAAPPPGASLRRSNRMEFDARLVQGQTATSGAVYLFQRAPRQLPPLLDMKQSYLDLIVDPVLGRTEEDEEK